MSRHVLEMTNVGPSPACAAAMADPRTTNPLAEQAWRDKLVREAAYFRSQKRGGSRGSELDDWLAAERDVDESLGRSHS